MKHFSLFRRTLQLFVILLFCLLPWLNASGHNEVGGSLFASDFFGIPFADPASALLAMASGALLGQWQMEALLLGALAALVLTFCLGRIFCGWLCPYGFFSDCVHAARNKSSQSRQANFPTGQLLLANGFCFFWLASMVLFGYPLISMLSFPGELSLVPLLVWQNLPLALLSAGLCLPLLALLCELLTRQRLWCRFVCPQSALLGAAAWLLPKRTPGLRVSWQAGQCVCGKDSPCRQACGLDLNPRRKGGPARRDCLMCGDCVETCARYGKALEFT